MNEIDLELVRENMLKMINLLEFDSMRSAGKAKLNSQHLHSMHELVDRYNKVLDKKPAQDKKEG